jgi:EAL domain-containing protein (putative c-di-GMP-specific phosphodiesterase class I)
MASKNTQKTFKAGEIIMRQGDKGESAYIIESGRVEITIESPSGDTQLLGTRGPGTMIGEMAIVDSAPRTATIKAVEDCKLLEITKTAFTQKLKEADPVLRMTTKVILARYRDTLTRASIAGERQTWPPAEALEINDAEHGDAVERVKIENDFKEAMKNKELSLHYQPVIDFKTGDVKGFEALMRWNHKDKGFISPGIFIPIIEQTDLILQASAWALDEACKALKRIENRTGHKGGFFMGVNFSSRDFSSENFVDSVYNTVSESDVQLSQIHLEITERLLMDQPDNARETLEMCRKAGMSIAIDDFGTGYSSLSYLHYFPIDTLKIDQSFVRNMTQDQSALELVRSIIALGKNMGMVVVAEGVEHKEEARLLKELGCDLAQGYLFARPMPELDVTNFVSKSEMIKI